MNASVFLGYPMEVNEFEFLKIFFCVLQKEEGKVWKDVRVKKLFFIFWWTIPLKKCGIFLFLFTFTFPYFHQIHA